MKHRPVSTRVFAAFALMGAAALPTAGCSPVSYPSMFPAVEQTPPQRADTPMDANQVQQATEALISDRNRLSAEAQEGGQPSTAAATPKKPAGSAAPDSATAASVSGPGGGAQSKN